MNAVDKIYAELRSGTVFGDIDAHRMGGTYFWRTLWLSPDKKFICYRHYGESACKNTKADLCWILREIFKMSPAEFLFRYTNMEEWSRIDECYGKG